MDYLLTRKSVRKYKDQEVPEEVVKDLLRAAMQAPSAKNTQPWQFIVIRDKALLNSIPDFLHPGSKHLKGAAVGILVCGDTRDLDFLEYWVQDCSAATQNILLAAHAIGLGAVWMGIYPVEDRIKGLQKTLNIPEGVIPLSLIALGYPDEERELISRFEENRVHYDKW